jgi:hypothetical protein
MTHYNNFSLLTKKILVCIIINFSCVLTSNTQENLKICIGSELSIDFGYRIITPSDTSFNEALFSLRNKAESPAWGYRYGISSLFHYKESLLINLGIMYTVKGYNATGPFNNQGITSIDLDLKNFYYFNYISSYLQVNKIIAFSDATFFYGLGISCNHFQKANHRTVTFYEDGTVNDITLEDLSRTYNNWTFEGLLQFGITYPYNDYLTIKISPVFRYGINHINKKDEFIERMISGGVHFGIFLNL